ncbi:Troponin C, isoform 2 [Papilio xuthus]|uniref:Troponin C, isoform 2 n=2 Tax=Papilio xuthus TaxID=66420 RepID=A0A194PRX5_PAPXU|nr:Troponin C, isoform 2 [Papilio xuthus]
MVTDLFCDTGGLVLIVILSDAHLRDITIHYQVSEVMCSGIKVYKIVRTINRIYVVKLFKRGSRAECCQRRQLATAHVTTPLRCFAAMETLSKLIQYSFLLSPYKDSLSIAFRYQFEFRTRFKIASCYTISLRANIDKRAPFVSKSFRFSEKMTTQIDDEQITMLRRAFSMFDSSKQGRIEKEKVRTILNTMVHSYDDNELDQILDNEDIDGSGKLNFDSFVRVATHFLDEDDEALQKELKEAFRLYDKEGNGYIPTSSLREILAALDDQLTPDQLNEMIAEIDTDASGTVDFDEFMEMMTGD